MDKEIIELTPLERAGAKTAEPGARFGAQYPGMRDYRRKRWVRIKGREGRANCFHVMSRIVDGLPYFDEEDKDALVVVLFKMARFCKVKVLTYCVMGNHFHALIEVSDAKKVRGYFSDEEKGWERLYTHLDCLYSKAYVAGLRRQVEAFLSAGRLEEAEEIREAFLKRMGDVSRFMWELKERYTKWFNQTHGRRGTLWHGRFKSVLVQGSEHSEHSQDNDGGYSEAMRTMAAYIDLNPVRAGLVEDPAEYRWSGYAAALAGQRRARRGINQIMGAGVSAWDEAGVATSYRRLLFRHGLDRREESTALETSGLRKGIPRERREAELRRLNAKVHEAGGLQEPKNEAAGEPEADFASKSSPALTRGLAFGEKGFVEEVFSENRESFGPKRKTGSRTIDGAPRGRLYSLRKIRRRLE